MKNIILIVFSLCLAHLSFSKSSFTFSAQDTVYEDVIVLTDKQKDVSHTLILKKDKEIVFTLKNGHKVKGKIREIYKDGFRIAGEKYKLSEIKKIRKRSKLSDITLGLGLATFILTFIGAIWFQQVNSSSQSSTVAGALTAIYYALLILAILLSIGGISLILILVGLLTMERMFLLDRNSVSYRFEQRPKSTKKSASSRRR